MHFLHRVFDALDEEIVGVRLDLRIEQVFLLPRDSKEILSPLFVLETGNALLEGGEGIGDWFTVRRGRSCRRLLWWHDGGWRERGGDDAMMTTIVTVEARRRGMIHTHLIPEKGILIQHILQRSMGPAHTRLCCQIERIMTFDISYNSATL